MKLKKKSGLIGIVSVLAGVSVVSVGFASWVVTAQVNENVDGTIVVNEALDHRYKIYETSIGSSHSDYLPNLSFSGGAQIRFTANKTVPTGGTVLQNPAWLTVGDGEDNEQLTVSMSFHLSNVTADTYDDVLANTSFALTGDNASSKYSTLSDANLICALPTVQFAAPNGANGESGVFIEYDGTDLKYTDADGDATTVVANAKLTYAKITITVKFAWGSAFSCNHDDDADTADLIVNPYYYYNRQVQTDGLATEAISRMTDIYTNLSGVGYSLNLRAE